jgi:hypothetical protein
MNLQQGVLGLQSHRLPSGLVLGHRLAFFIVMGQKVWVETVANHVFLEAAITLDPRHTGLVSLDRVNDIPILVVLAEKRGRSWSLYQIAEKVIVLAQI